MHSFTCPECGHHRLGFVSHGHTLTQDVLFADDDPFAEDGVCYRHSDYSYGGDLIEYYCCKNCGMQLRDEYDNRIDVHDDFITYLTTHKQAPETKLPEVDIPSLDSILKGVSNV